MRPRRRDAQANDQRILDAAMGQVNAVGVDSLTATAVAAAAGLTTGALYARYANVDELLVDLWERRCAASVGGLVRRVVLVRRAGGPPDDLPEVSATLARPPAPLAAGLQLAMVARRIDLLGDVVPGSFAHWFADLSLDDVGAGPARALDLATATMAVGLGALGLVDGLVRPAWTEVGAWLFGTAPAVDGAYPDPRPQTTELIGAVGDPVDDALLRAAQDVVARSGVHATTLTRVGRAARLPPTAAHDRFGSREKLLVDLVGRAGTTIAAPQRRAAVFASPESLTAAVSALLVPLAHTRRRLFAEILLASAHDPVLAATYTDHENASNAATAGLLAGTFGSPGAARTMVGIAAAVNTGVAIVDEVTGVLGGVDWRPVTAKLFAAARSSPPAG